jgi:hypothetical protein
MTESTFPFADAAEEPEGSGSSRKTLLVAGAGAVAVAVLGYFVVLPMLTGPADSATPLAIVHHHVKPKAKTKATTTTVKKPVAQPASYADVSARTDPFKPLVVEADAATTDAPAGTTTTGTTTGTTTTSSTSVAGTRVILLHVFSKDGKSYAQTKVGDTVYTPVVGSTFGGSYKLLATSGTSATYLFGDEQFSLSEGQEVLK